MNSFKKTLARLRASAPRGIWALAAAILIITLVFSLGELGSAPDKETIRDEASSAPDESVWTCSMHPQIKLSQPGKCPLCFMDLIPLESHGGGELDPRQLRMSAAARELARIRTTPATRGVAAAEVRLVGRVTYDETNLAYISAWVPGRLDRLYAGFTGVEVEKGAPLVKIYSPELLVAQEELLQAKSAIAALGGSESTLLRSTARTTLEAARDKLRLYGLTAKQIEKTETGDATSEHVTVYAPIGGVVVHKEAKEGTYVKTGERIYSIADITSLWVVFEAYESDLPWLRVGQTVEFRSPSFPGRRFEATVSFIDPVVNPGTRTVRVRAEVENPDKALKPDMFVRGVVKSRVEGEQQPLLIPVTAPLITGERAVAYVEVTGGEEPVFEGREIELGPRAGDYYVVRGGISEGEMVVTNGAFKIDSELQIQAKPSMMSAAGGVFTAGHQHGSPRHQTSMHTGHAEEHPAKPSISDKAREALDPVYESYFGVQMGLARDDLEATKKAAEKLTNAIEDVGDAAFARSGHGRWLSLSQQMTKHAKIISGAKDIEQARDGFFYLSQAAIDLHDSFGHHGKESFYLTHCPMARGGDGAYWLQTENIVWNSFYGASMLRCGSIKDELPPQLDEKK